MEVYETLMDLAEAASSLRVGGKMSARVSAGFNGDSCRILVQTLKFDYDIPDAEARVDEDGTIYVVRKLPKYD